jgi:hypothetical protein
VSLICFADAGLPLDKGFGSLKNFAASLSSFLVLVLEL